MSTPNTLGAGKSGAESKERFGPDSAGFWFIAGLVLLILSPVATLTFIIAITIGQLRRVRMSRMMIGALVALIVGALIAGLNPLRALQWHWDGWWSWLSIGGARELIQKGLDAATDLLVLPSAALPGAGISLGDGFAMQMPLAIPIGLFVAAPFLGWSAYRRMALTELEDSKFDFRYSAQSRPCSTLYST